MAKALPRPDHTIVSGSPDYAANREVVMTSLSKSPEFGKMRSRPPLFPLTPGPPGQYDIHYKAVESQRGTTDFSKSRPREKHPHLPLPAYMQDSYTRFSVGSFSEKTIKLNCTRDSLLAPTPTVMDYLKTLHSTLRSARSIS